MGGNDNKRKKGYYKNCGKGSKRSKYQAVLNCGMQGFLITCGNRAEKDAMRDAYKILNDFADEMYGPEFKDQEGDHSGEEEDIEKALQKEVTDIKSKKKVPRRFQAVEAGVHGCVFIQTSLEKPDELLYRIITDLHKTRVSRSRFIMKIFPVLMTCRADSEKIKSAALEFLPKAFHGLVTFSYEIAIKVRNNSSGLGRTSILSILNDAFTELGLPGKVKFGSADYVISVDVLKSVCCLSIMKDFNQFKKYNLHEIAMADQNKSKTTGENNGTKNDSESKTAARRNSGDNVVGNELGRDTGAVNVDRKIQAEETKAPDPFMSKIAGLIQSKVAAGPSVKKTPNIEEASKTEDGGASAFPSEETKLDDVSQESMTEGNKSTPPSLSCPYVASAI